MSKELRCSYIDLNIRWGGGFTTRVSAHSCGLRPQEALLYLLFLVHLLNHFSFIFFPFFPS